MDEILIKQKALGMSHRINTDDNLLNIYDFLFDWIPEGVDKSIRDFNPDSIETEADVFLPIIQGGDIRSFYASILAHAFRTRGYNPVVLTCDSALEFCIKKGPESIDRATCSACEFYGNKCFDMFGIDRIYLSSFDITVPDDILSGDLKSIYHRGVNISKFAHTSARRYLKKYTLEKEDKKIVKGFLRSGYKLAEASHQIISNKNIEAALGVDDQYIHAGIPLQVAHINDINSYSFGRSALNESITFGRFDNRNSFEIYSNKTTVESFLSEPLLKKEENRINSIMNKRKKGELVRVAYSSTSSRSIKNPGEKNTIGLYPNLIWDAAREYDTGPFSNIIEWLGETVQYFIESTDCNLIIKCHPAEAKRGTNQPVGQWIREIYGPLPSNIDILPPETNINTYQLIEDLDATIVFNSHVGLEAAFAGKPVLVGGNSHYRGFGFTIDPKTKQEYFNIVDSLHNMEMSKKQQSLAKRYAYFYFVMAIIDFPFIKTKESQGIYEISDIRHENISPGNEPFDNIVSSIIQGDPVYSKHKYPLGRDSITR